MNLDPALIALQAALHVLCPGTAPRPAAGAGLAEGGRRPSAAVAGLDRPVPAATGEAERDLSGAMAEPERRLSGAMAEPERRLSAAMAEPERRLSAAMAEPERRLSAAMAEPERRLSAALMRVNHVGEVCAQALYQAQALTARSPALREQMLGAAREEATHLQWTRQRLEQLNSRHSLLNPVWYAGAFAIGLAAGRLGDAASLGFVVETERQVEAHLAGHLDRLPQADTASRAIVERMKADEARHADEALAAGAAPVPEPVKWLMRAAARVMTTVAHRV